MRRRKVDKKEFLSGGFAQNILFCKYEKLYRKNIWAQGSNSRIDKLRQKIILINHVCIYSEFIYLFI
jgi:hypothetical protein